MKLKRKSITIILISVIIVLSFILNQNRKNNIIKANNIKALKVQSDNYLNAGDVNNALATYKEVVALNNSKVIQNELANLVKIGAILDNIYTIEKSNASLYDQDKLKVNNCNEILKIKKSVYFEDVKDELETYIEATDAKNIETKAELKATNSKNNVISLIKLKKYEEAEKLCYFGIGTENGDTEVDALYSYSSVLMYEVTGGADMKERALTYCEYISPYYSGTYHNELKNLLLKYITFAEWQHEYNSHIKVKGFSKKPEPSIGMTSKEVRASRWGSPDDVNKTTTASGITEQWVYSSGKYIYLDNGVVTTIQD